MIVRNFFGIPKKYMLIETTDVCSQFIFIKKATEYFSLDEEGSPYTLIFWGISEFT